MFCFNISIFSSIDPAEINRKTVKTAEEAVRLTEHPKDKTTLLRVWRNGGSHYVVVDENKNG